MSQIEFTVPGVPVGKGRPRATAESGKARMYTPAKTARYESTAALFASHAMSGRPPFTGPMCVFMDIVLPVPESWSKRRQAAALAGQEWPTKKPDMDNVVKGIFDALNGIVWKDDVQVVALNVGKVYGPTPGVAVRVRPILPPAPAYTLESLAENAAQMETA